MTTKVLLVDPDIDFIVSIRRALENSGDYKVNAFPEGRAALDLLRRESHDVAILDITLTDIPLEELVTQIRRVQPWLFIMVSARNAADLEQIAGLNVQGSITKPYVARQLGPVMQEAANKNRQARKSGVQPVVPSAPATPPGMPPEPPRPPDSTPEEPLARLPINPTPPPPPTPPEPIRQPPSSDMFDRFSDWLSELAAEPDETFTQVTQVPHSSSQIAAALQDIATSLKDFDESVATEPPIPEDATVRELVSGQSLAATPPVPEMPETPAAPAVPDLPPPTLPEPPAAMTSATAELALEIASDDTIPLDGLASAIVEKTEMLPPEERPSPAAGKRMSETVGLRAIQSPQPDQVVPPDAQAEPAPDSTTEPDTAAALALQLTQLSVESAAQIAMLTRNETLLAMAGLLPDWAVQDVLFEINRAWKTATASERAPEGGQQPVLFRYVRLANHTDYLLYSARTLDDMTLTMLFPGDVPLKVIRRQSRQLREALEKVPEPEPVAEVPPEVPASPPVQEIAAATPEQPAEAAPVPEAAQTLHSRPTDLRAPTGLRDGAAAPESAAEKAPELAGYTFVLLPRRTLDAEQVPLFDNWLRAIAQAHGWQIDGLETQPTYLAVQVHIPEEVAPSTAVEVLMSETAQRIEPPGGAAELWAEPFYVVAPGRPVTPQEIANFIGLYREAERATE